MAVFVLHPDPFHTLMAVSVLHPDPSHILMAVSVFGVKNTPYATRVVDDAMHHS